MADSPYGSFRSRSPLESAVQSICATRSDSYLLASLPSSSTTASRFSLLTFRSKRPSSHLGFVPELRPPLSHPKKTPPGDVSEALFPSSTSLSSLLLQLQTQPEDLLSFLCCYDLFITTETLLEQFFQVIDSVLEAQGAELERCLASIFSTEKINTNLFSLGSFLGFVPYFLMTWVSFDNRLEPYYQRLLDNVTTRWHSHPLLLDLPDILSSSISDKRNCMSRVSLDIADPNQNRQLAKEFFRLPHVLAARCLHAAHLDLLRNIQPWTLIAYALHPSDKSPCYAIPQHFNATVSWIMTTCLKPK